jgi:hypothetical protein
MGLSVDPRVVRRLLGLRLIAADLVWIDTLIKADVEKEKDQRGALYRTVETIVALDPDNVIAYYIGGLYLSVIKDDVKGATALLLGGARYLDARGQRMAGDWMIYFTLGYHLLFEEHDIDGSSEWFQKAGACEDAPFYVKATAQQFTTEKGMLEGGARMLSDFYRKLKTPEEKRRVERKMLEVGARQELLDLNEKFERFLFSTGAYALPRNRQFQLFMRSIGHGGKDLLGRALSINAVGKIAPQARSITDLGVH